MSDQARIAEVLRRHRRVLNLDSGTSHCFAARSGQCDFAGGVRADWEAHVAPLIDAALHPRIDTVEQLDALPEGAVVRSDDDGGVYVKDHRYTGPGEPWWPTGYDVECASERIALPARVIHTPEVAS